MKRQGLKKIISVLMIIIMLINVIPNFGLLKSVTYAAEPSKGIVLKPGLSSFETMTDGSKRFVLNIYMKDISSAIGVVDFTYNSDKLIPAKYTETDLTSMGMGVIKQLTDSTNFTDAAQYSNVIDNSYDGNSYIDASSSEIYATFIEKDSNPVEAVGEIIICSINFKVVDDSLNFSDITAEDFGINAEYSFVNIDGVDEQEGFFHVEGFSNTTTPVVTSISITTDPKKEYIVGESLDLSSMVVTATYDNDPTNTKVLTDSEYTTNASELDLTTAGTPTLKVTYKGTDIAEGASAPTADVNLTVREEKITKIEFQGFDTSYKQGDTIDLSKISVIATYEKSGDKVLTSDKYTLTATGNSIVGNGITLTNSGDTIITATLKEDTSKTATKTITIAEKQLIGIEVTAPTKDVYKVGDTLDLAGLTVNAKYSNNGTETTEQVTTGYTTSITNGDKLNNAGVQTITVNYKGQTATFDIVVFPTKLVGTEEDSLSTVEVTEGFEWDNGSNTLSVGENTYLLKYTNTDPAKVKTNSVEVLGIPSNLTATYGETLADVKYNNGTLPNGFSWADATTSVGNAGEQTHSISYTGYTNLNAKVTVAKKTLTKADLTYTMLSGKTYNGQPINDINVTAPAGTGAVTVKYYKDGETSGSTTAPTNVGTYTVKVSVLEGQNYTALAETELDGSFEITRGKLVAGNFDTTIPADKVYDGTAITAATATVKSEIVGAGTTVTVKYYKDGESVGTTTAPTDYGTYTVKVNINEGTNYFAADGTDGKEEIEIGSFSITKKQLSASDITVTDPTPNVYDGTAKIPSVTANVTGAGTITATYWQGSTQITNPTDAGTYTVKITTSGATNYEDVTIPMEVGTFEIEKADMDTSKITVTPDAEKTYDGTASKATATLDSSVPGATDVTIDVTYINADGTEVANPTDAGTYAIKVSSTGGANYNALDKTDRTETIVINKKTLTLTDVTPSETLPATKIYDGIKKDITAEVPTGAGAVTITYYKENGTNTSEMKNADTYTVKVSVAEGTNYTGLAETELGTYTIGKATLAPENFDTTIPADKVYDGTPITAATATVKSGIVGAGTTVTVKYYKDGQTVGSTTAPTDYGAYTVKVNVNEGENYFAADGTAGLPEIEIGSFSITKKQLTASDIEITPKTFTYNGTKQIPTVQPKANVTGAGTIAVTYWQGSTQVAEPTDAGIYTVKITTTGATNYDDITTAMEVGTFEIEKADMDTSKITVTPDAEKTYDGTASKATATLDSSVPGATDVTIDVTYINADGTEVANPTDAGTYAIKVSSTGGKNYNALDKTDRTETIVINKVTLSADDIQCTLPENLIYNNTSKKATVTVSKDLGNGKTLNVATNDITVTYKDATGNIVADPKNAGTYTIDVSVSAGKNYEALTVAGVETYTVEKATLVVGDFTISGIPAGGSKEYDGADVSVTATQKSHITETLATQVEYYASTDTEHPLTSAPSGVGSYIVKLKVTEGTNYKAANLDLGTFTITPKGFDKNKVKYTNTAEYDGTNKDNTTVNIYVEGDTLATIADVKFYKDGAEVAARNVGTYTVKADVTTTESGHVGVIEIGTFTITAKPITVEIQNETIVYGEELTTIRTNDDVDICAGDNIDDIITYELSAKTVGTQNIIGKVKDTETAKNYNVTFVNGQCTITEKPITVQIGNTSSVYTGAEPTMPATSTLITIPDGAIVGTDDLGITLTKASGVDAGDYAITGAYTNTDYDITFVNKEDNTKTTGTYTITKATLTSEDFNKDLPTTDVTFGTTVTINPTYKGGITVADAGAITVKYYKKDDNTEANPTAVGTYIVKVSVPGGTNYYPADGSTDSEGNTYEEITLGEFSIVRSSELPTITVTEPTDNTYDGTKKEPTVTIPDGTGSSTITYYKKEDDGTETPVAEPIDAGAYIVKVATVGGENYGPMAETKVGEFTILPRPVEVTIDDLTSVYGDAIKTLTSSVTDGNIITGDDLGITLTKENGTDVDTYAITGTAANTNYDVTFIDGTYEITPKAITVTIDNLTSVYGKALEALTCSVAETLATGDTLEQIIELSTTATTTSNVGTYDITGAIKNNNYTVTYTNANNKGTYTITKADPECSITELPATYGDTLANVTLPTRADGTYTWQDVPTTSVGNVGKHTFKVTFTPNDTTNYNTKTDIDVTVNVAKAIPTYTVPTGIEGYEGQPLSSIDITANTGFSWTDATTTIPLIKNNGETFNTTMTYTPADTNNFETVENIPVQVKVKENEVKAIRVSSTKADGSNPEYYEGETFERADILVEAEWAIGGWQTVTDYTIVDETRSLTTSDTQMEINYAGKTANQAITVKADEVTNITITPPTKLEYNYGDAIDLTGATITKIWASGRTQTSDTEDMTLAMLENADITDFTNMEVLGQKQITVKYGAIVKVNAFQITVNDVVTGIAIVDKDNLQKEYDINSTLNYNYKDTTNPVKVTVTYAGSGAREIDLADCTLSGYDLTDETKIGNLQTVKVTYGGKQDSFNVKLRDYVKRIRVTKYKGIYDVGESLDIQEVKAIMASNVEKVITGYTTSGFNSTTPGTVAVTVNYDGKEATITVTIRNKVADMYIEKLPSQISSDGTTVDKTIPFGTDLTKLGGTIIVKDSINPAGKEISMTDPAVSIEGYNKNGVGEQTVTVRYTYTEITDEGEEVTNSKTATFNVTVEDYETGIKVTPPSKTTYDYGTQLDLTGATVSIVWASGKTTDTTEISGGMISGYNATTVGTQTIKVNAFGKENVGRFNVTVVDKTLGISMKKLPNKIEYTEGEGIDVTGAVLNVTKLSGTKEIPVTKEMISGYNPGKIGTQVITVTYDGFITEFVVNVKEAEKKPNKPNRPVNPSKPATSEVDKYTVTFIDYDGSVIKTEEVEIGKSATAPKLEERKGYKFLGWDTDFEVIEKDIIVMAKYEEVIRAKVNAPDDMEVEKGEDLDLSDVTIEIFDGEGNRIDEIPVTKDMISGFDSEKVGTQIVRVTYIGEDGFEYTDTFKVRVKRPAEVLGVKDEATTEESNLNGIIIPTAIGIGAIGILLLLIALATRKNVEIYAITEDERKLVGKEKITKNNRRIDLDEYEKKLVKSNIEIVLNKNITRKLDEEMVDIIFKGKKSTYKVKDIDNKEFSIKMKNA